MPAREDSEYEFRAPIGFSSARHHYRKSDLNRPILILWPVPSYRLIPGDFQPDAGPALMGRHGTGVPGMLVACRHSWQIGAFLDVERQTVRPLRPLGRGDRRRARGHFSAFPVLISQ